MTTRTIAPFTACLTLGSLIAVLFLSGCAAPAPPQPKSADEMALQAEEKASENRVFYSGWLHPN